MNSINIIGRLAKDPKTLPVHTDKKGRNFCFISVAVRNKIGETDFIECYFGGGVHEILTKYVGKGDLVGLTGSLAIRKSVYKEVQRENATVFVSQITLLGSNPKKA